MKWNNIPNNSTSTVLCTLKCQCSLKVYKHYTVKCRKCENMCLGHIDTPFYNGWQNIVFHLLEGSIKQKTDQLTNRVASWACFSCQVPYRTFTSLQKNTVSKPATETVPTALFEKNFKSFLFGQSIFKTELVAISYVFLKEG